MEGEFDRFTEQRIKSIRLTLTGLIAALTLGAAALIAAQVEGIVGAIGLGAMVFLAAFAVGSVLGFLFAVPRVLSESSGDRQNDDQRSGGEGADSGEAAISRRIRGRLLGSNTNLERISDWLTTMLVGVGLSQIGNIPKGLVDFSLFLESRCPVGLARVGQCALVLPTVGPMILIFGLVVGFLFLYLFTRLVIVTLLNDVERVIDAGGELGLVKIHDDDARQATVDAAKRLEGSSENPTFRALAESGTPSVEESLSVMNAYLYNDEGYQRVIDLGGKLSRSPAAQSPRYWVFMACAFGQKHHQLLNAKETSPGELRSAHDSAMDCVRRALALRPSYKDWIWRLSNPKADDNDLQDFRRDSEFLSALGRK